MSGHVVKHLFVHDQKTIYSSVAGTLCLGVDAECTVVALNKATCIRFYRMLLFGSH